MRHKRCIGSGSSVPPNEVMTSGYLVEARCPHCRRIICLQPNLTFYRHTIDEWEPEEPIRVITVWPERDYSDPDIVRGRTIIDDEDEGVHTPEWVFRSLRNRPHRAAPVASAGDTSPVPSPPHAADEI